MSAIITRRALLTTGALGAGALLSGCDQVANTPSLRKILFSGEKMNYGLARALTDRNSLAKEYRPDQMSPIFRVNGTNNPNTDRYNAMVAENFAHWRLEVGGLVNRPLSISHQALMAMPARTQITRHDCVEGWSAIGKWHGPMLGTILNAADIRRAARYVVFTCADLYSGQAYYESLDLIDAFHPQTILAWAMNDRMLSVAHGAPIRLRVERQLGYKHAKYVMRIDAVASLAGIGLGKGGYWEDRVDYDWYAGI
ncbi:MAG: molybdopterin-dependent oxidoreductase [Sphingomonas sp.]|jgi:DMSO/TMAO reductase YedYZ molybdopterin-dependent catalytic subunit|uniref:molybdopterin-dependent oxidoreductase n=2 Tax=Pseudomonadota TaxID=1224 RepID=UPI00053E0DBC|nr:MULTISPECIES: molybdopterin-dependent oxidoreductase [unclassified Sphingomonas]MDR6848037.1 DMSO/TMAO reductase YedYZ molybdopterin-dependent catalytic subunit [Sphingomonas sp. BE137]MDR7258283.1 DMSO/TMAO reductase YedYZ molybdopterin-dependent catalytic subunit [Sphingomonas sp. BE270]